MKKILLPTSLTLLLAAGFLACSSSGASTVDDEAPVAEQAPLQLLDSEVIPVGESPMKGPEDAWVTMVIFADFGCPFCARVAATVDEVVDHFDDGETLRVVFKYFPLNMNNGQPSRATMAAAAAAEQGSFWEMHDALFDEFDRVARDPQATEELIAEVAMELDLDAERFARDMESRELMERIHADVELGLDLELRGVPAVFINGGFLPGAQSPEIYIETIANLKAILEENVNQGSLAREEVYRDSVEALFAHTTAGREEPPPPAEVVDLPIIGDRPQTQPVDNTLVNVGAFLSLGDTPSLNFQRRIDEVAANYDDVRVVYFHTLHEGDSNTTVMAHRALEAAQSTDQVRELIDWLTDEENPWREDPQLLEGLLDEMALELAEEDSFMEALIRDYEAAGEVGVYGTPTAFINGIRVVGLPSEEELSEIIEEQRAIAQRVTEINEIHGEELYREMVEGNRNR